ncbi:DUF1698 domain-containing protein [Dyella sp.]|jgi:tRNA (mo5U34)-methyltransferase|uniref:DUF1698 domain-containing protein n=1 Tax=Dyella sp. TaxID=1869338 RepID=UPI002D765E35|nr:DUF1698 domain-containing protein [Dyella sp.]HET6433091.1 DUF1698 domain-containing protein [Dyella sp.]
MNTLRTLQSHGSESGPLAQHIRALGPWFHNIHLPDGSQTAPDHPLGDFPAFKWAGLAPLLAADMRGLRVLDIGCNAGYYSLQMAQRGAQVVAMDHDPHYLAQAEWVVRQFGLSSQVTLRQGDVYDLAGRRERFDVVLFLGVFYHLRYPLLGLDLAAGACDDLLLFQSLCMPGPDDALPAPRDVGYLGRDEMQNDHWPKMAFVEGELAGDPTNWWLPNPGALEAMVRSAGFEVVARPEPDTCVCRRNAATATASEAALEGVLAHLQRGG